jgi:hypothetical protein
MRFLGFAGNHTQYFTPPPAPIGAGGGVKYCV